MKKDKRLPNPDVRDLTPGRVDIKAGLEFEFLKDENVIQHYPLIPSEMFISSDTMLSVIANGQYWHYRSIVKICTHLTSKQKNLVIKELVKVKVLIDSGKGSFAEVAMSIMDKIFSNNKFPLPKNRVWMSE